MPAPVIRIENISKLYRLGKRDVGSDTLLRTLAQAALAPVRNFRRLRSLTHFEEGADAPDILWALRDVSFEVAQGEVLGLIGRNGAGKSTLLKILSRITPPTRGRIEFRGRLASLLEVGTGFHGELSGRDNIFLNGATLGMSRREIARKFDEIVAFSEIEKFIDTPVKRYSSGMYVRLAFAVAAHLEPDILIVDEVLAVGDAAFQKKCLGKMSDISQGDGRTIICVSHNMAMMKALSQRIIWLDNGKIAATGPAEDVVNLYLKNNVVDAATVVDLKDRARPANFGGQLRVIKLEWLSGLPLFHTERFAAAVTIEAFSDLAEISLGFGFSTVEGLRLLTYESDDPGVRMNVKKGERHTVLIEIPHLPVPPGTFSIDVGARSGLLLGLDYLPDCTKVEISPGKYTKGHHLHPGASIQLPSSWRWEK